MNLIEQWYEKTNDDDYKQKLFQYAAWSKHLQNLQDAIPGQDILGEPKFYINGSQFLEPWGRPQNDGPALRALVFIHFAQKLIDNNEMDYVQQNLYQKSLESEKMGIIKKDLEYISHHWSEENYDLWEEIWGHHFFTSVVQHKALREGAKLATRFNDFKAAEFYEKQANALNERLKLHFLSTSNTIMSTLLPHSGPQKMMELDTSILLAVLINPSIENLNLRSPQIQNTALALKDYFKQHFPINKFLSNAVLMGRYPGDSYDGYDTNGEGNPWFICTAIMAKFYFELGNTLSAKALDKGYTYLQLGDEYLELIQKYAPDLNLAEQIHHSTGIQQGASSLTWSYVSLLEALDSRSKLLKKIAINK